MAEASPSPLDEEVGGTAAGVISVSITAQPATSPSGVTRVSGAGASDAFAVVSSPVASPSDSGWDDAADSESVFVVEVDVTFGVARGRALALAVSTAAALPCSVAVSGVPTRTRPPNFVVVGRLRPGVEGLVRAVGLGADVDVGLGVGEESFPASLPAMA